jgi:hypothetical protein
MKVTASNMAKWPDTSASQSGRISKSPSHEEHTSELKLASTDVEQTIHVPTSWFAVVVSDYSWAKR